MTESLIQKIEDKVLLLLAEITNLRQEVSQLRSENTSLKAEQSDHTEKLQELVSLLDVLDDSHDAMKMEGLSVVI
jgi:regulator of replication initiation timing